MNNDECGTGCCRGIPALAGWIIGIVGTFLLVAALVWVMHYYTRPAPLTQNRVAERLKNIADLKGADTDALSNYGWVDQGKGVVRLPISVAMELTLKEFANPASGKTNLVARHARANPAPPPAAPPPPNPFE